MKTSCEHGLKSVGALSPVLSRAGQRRSAAFSLIELLVVISIMAILAVIAVPVMSGFGKSNSIAAADRQLLDDLSLARAKAISGRTTVYMVFIPQNIGALVQSAINPAILPVVQQQATALYGGQYTTYALLSLRTVGDQPGRPTARYLTEWKKLPDGVFFATNKFMFFPRLTPPAQVNGVVRSFETNVVFPFPYVLGTNEPMWMNLPYVAFDYQGRMVSGAGDQPVSFDEYIPLARGNVSFPRTGPTNAVDITQPVNVRENPENNSVAISNVVHLDALTGRARIVKQELQ